MRPWRSAPIMVSACSDHALACRACAARVQDVGAAVELDVEALGDGVGDGDLAEGVAFAAAQAHPPGLRGDRLPVDRVHVVLAAVGAVLEVASASGADRRGEGSLEPVGVRVGT